MNFKLSNQRGIGLIEVLVSLIILAVGLLSVATLHTHIIEQSGDNKARAEAMTIAQQRLEQMRNYSATVTDEAGFNILYAVANNTNSTVINGTNAAFTRTESIANGNNVKDITVNVAWSDRNGAAQTVNLNSSIGWQKPRSSADVANDSFTSLVPSATGRARLGSGVLSDYSSPTLISGNIDGMKEYKTTDGNYLLVDASNTVVLTLLDACDLGTGVCTDFVKISGRVYIDTATQGALKPGDVFVKASDAAFCQQYYFTNPSDLSTLQVLAVGASAAKTTSPNGDYKYYDYTCYLGGGWHGNIGLILKGGITQKDKVCQGDPTSINAWEEPEIAARRVYRGMTYKKDANGDPIQDGNGDPIYYSIGVADALILPASGDTGHDFIIASLGISDTTGDKCISSGVMIRADSYVSAVPGAMFQGMPTDFFCLNEGVGYVDNFDTAIFGIASQCPFDPSDPPSSRHVLSGQIIVNNSSTVTAIVDNMTVNTSDGLGNCKITAIDHITNSPNSRVDYACNIYDWGNGWNGYVQLNTDFSVLNCSSYREAFTVITADTVAATRSCNLGSILTIAGSVIPNGNKVLAGAITSDVGGLCTLAADGLSYSCFSSIIASPQTWSGTLSFTSSNGSKLCINDPSLPVGSSFTILDGTSTAASISLTNIDPSVISSLSLTLQVVANNGTCP